MKENKLNQMDFFLEETFIFDNLKTKIPKTWQHGLILAITAATTYI